MEETVSKIKDTLQIISEEKNISVEDVKNLLLKSILIGYRTLLYNNKNTTKQGNIKDLKKEDKIDEVDARLEIDRKGHIKVFIKKVVTKRPSKLLKEISKKEASHYKKDADYGDEIEIELDFDNFSRNTIRTIRQEFDKEIKTFTVSKIYDQLKTKEGQLIYGKIQRILNRNVYVAIENSNIEGVLPPSQQSPIDNIKVGERRLMLLSKIVKVTRRNEENSSKLYIELSRTSPLFIQRLFEKEIPEVAKGIVKIVKIARHVGYKTKVAVISEKEDVEPVGACLGVKGFRIQNIRKEIGMEVIEVIQWSDHPETLIANVLNLPKLSNGKIYTLSEDKKIAVVVVKTREDQKNVIGKEGINVRLAVELTGWKIDIRTEEEFAASEYSKLQSKMFDTIFQNNTEEETEEYEEVDEETSIFELEEFLGRDIVLKLQNAGIDTIDKLIDYHSQGRLNTLPNITTEEFMSIQKFIEENIEIEEEEEIQEHEVIICPNCNKEIDADSEVCPYCGYKFDE